ncbi:MAG: site-2 protease family protein [Clostridiales bacterium]|nr:site-2 protease family protein [Clostridiales bacterium]
MYNFSLDKRVIYVVIAIMVIMSLTNLITNPGALFSLLASIPGVLIAITFHEYAHGLAAYKLGDNTAKDEGRLSLNPLAHLDPIGTLMLVFAGFGWGKPVHVDPRNYTRKISMEKGEAIVSLAGPLMNIILAFIFTLIYCAIYKFAGAGFLHSTMGSVLMLMIFYTISINVGLGVFNLIPLPPLDGSKIIMPFLPYKAKEWFVNNEQIFYLVFVVLWITGLAGIIISPAISWITNGFLSIGKIIF